MSNTGWICPRCAKVHAPFVPECKCAPGLVGGPIGIPVPSYPYPGTAGDVPFRLTPNTCVAGDGDISSLSVR